MPIVTSLLNDWDTSEGRINACRLQHYFIALERGSFQIYPAAMDVNHETGSYYRSWFRNPFCGQRTLECWFCLAALVVTSWIILKFSWIQEFFHRDFSSIGINSFHGNTTTKGNGEMSAHVISLQSGRDRCPLAQISRALELNRRDARVQFCHLQNQILPKQA